MLRDATAIARQSVCWPLKKHANLITANFASLWPPHVFQLARQDEAIDNLVANWDTTKPIKTDRLGA